MIVYFANYHVWKLCRYVFCITQFSLFVHFQSKKIKNFYTFIHQAMISSSVDNIVRQFGSLSCSSKTWDWQQNLCPFSFSNVGDFSRWTIIRFNCKQMCSVTCVGISKKATTCKHSRLWCIKRSFACTLSSHRHKKCHHVVPDGLDSGSKGLL